MKYSVMLSPGMAWGKRGNLDRNGRQELSLDYAYYLGTYCGQQCWDIACTPEVFSWLTLKYGLEKSPVYDNEFEEFDYTQEEDEDEV